MKTTARFIEKHNIQFFNDDMLPLNGDVIKDDVIFRYKNGYLHNSSDGEPAIDCPDGHVEFFENGKLNNQSQGLPAIIDNYGAVIEFYEQGVLINIVHVAN